MRMKHLAWLIALCFLTGCFSGCTTTRQEATKTTTYTNGVTETVKVKADVTAILGGKQAVELSRANVTKTTAQAGSSGATQDAATELMIALVDALKTLAAAAAKVPITP